MRTIVITKPGGPEVLQLQDKKWAGDRYKNENAIGLRDLVIPSRSFGSHAIIHLQKALRDLVSEVLDSL